MQLINIAVVCMQLINITVVCMQLTNITAYVALLILFVQF